MAHRLPASGPRDVADRTPGAEGHGDPGSPTAAEGADGGGGEGGSSGERHRGHPQPRGRRHTQRVRGLGGREPVLIGNGGRGLGLRVHEVVDGAQQHLLQFGRDAVRFAAELLGVSEGQGHALGLRGGGGGGQTS